MYKVEQKRERHRKRENRRKEMQTKTMMSKITAMQNTNANMYSGNKFPARERKNSIGTIQNELRDDGFFQEGVWCVQLT